MVVSNKNYKGHSKSYSGSDEIFNISKVSLMKLEVRIQPVNKHNLCFYFYQTLNISENTYII